MNFVFVMNRFLHNILVVGIAFVSVIFLAICYGPAFAWDLTIAWDPNREPNLDGYTVYYKKYSPGPPYDYVGDLPLSTFVNPDKPVTQITNLENDINYYFALTAYDTDGNESSFSTNLCASSDGQTILNCTPPASSSHSNSSGSSSSAGCFIQSSGGPASILQILLVLAIILSVMLPAVLSKREQHPMKSG